MIDYFPSSDYDYGSDVVARTQAYAEMCHGNYPDADEEGNVTSRVTDAGETMLEDVVRLNGGEQVVVLVVVMVSSTTTLNGTATATGACLDRGHDHH